MAKRSKRLVRQRSKAHIKGVKAKKKMRSKRKARGQHSAAKKRRVRAARKKG